MKSQIIKTQLELDCAKHMVWFQDMFHENPVKIVSESEAGLKPEFARIMEDAYMECLRKELALYCAGKVEIESSAVCPPC